MKKFTFLSVFLLLVSWQINAQIIEGFESSASLTSWGFFQSEIDDPGFILTSSRVNSGDSAIFHDDDNISAESDSWLVSPAYTCGANDELKFSYNQNFTGFSYNYSGVWISTASNDPIANPGDFSELVELDGTSTGGFSEDSWTEHVENLAAYNGQTIYIAFKFTGDFDHELYIDDFSLDAAPSCLEPTTLTAANITATSADLGWTLSGTETEWNVAVLPDGAPAPTTGDSTVSTNPFTASGLTPSTDYDFYVQAACSNPASLMISGVYDAPLTGGTPKGVELFVVNDIADLSIYGLSSANNGGGATGSPEFTFPAVSATAGTFIYVASEATEFTNFFGFAPDYTDGAMGINGDDAIELFESGSVIDVFGDVNTDGTGQAWEYLDGWAYRNDNESNNGGTFDAANWTFSGINVFDGETSNGTAATPFPIGSLSGPTADVSTWAGPFSFTTLESCPAPTALADSATTSTSASIYWTTGGASTWIVEYDTAGFAQGTGNILVVNNSSDTILSGLNANTEYEVYVRDFCGVGDSSAWVGPISIFTGYCQPAPSSVDGDGITNVTFGQTLVVNNTTGTETNNYGDYSAQIGDGAQSTTLNVDITYETGVTYETEIWVDWNNDLDFDDLGENVYSGVSLGDNPTTLNASFTIPLTVPLGNYRMRIGGTDFATLTPCYTGSWASIEDYTLQVTAAPSCTAPTALADSAVTTSSASIYWTTGGASTWIVEYDTAGFTQGTGNVLVVNTSADTVLTGLTSDTEYEVYVRDYCGGTDSSAWTGPTTFSTLKDYCSGDVFTDDGGITGDYSSNANETWTICPDNSGDIVTVTFTTFNTENGWDGLMIYDGDDNTAPLISSGSTFGRTTCPDGAWTGTTTLSLTGANATVQSTHTSGCLTFVFTSDGSGQRAGWTADVVCAPPPACAAPTALADSAVTTSSASIYWTTGGATTWIVEYDTAGFTQGTGNILVVNTSADTVLTGLTADTEYEVYVRDYCGGTDSSAWTGPITFFTGYCQPAPSSVDGDGITNVTFGQTLVVNNSTGTETNNYGDYSAQIGDGAQSTTLNVDITYETGVTYETEIWVDWNNDLDFDDLGENVYSGVSLGDNPTTLNASFTIPLTVPLGNYRMRIGGTDFATLTPCYTGSWASIEDYTLQVTAAPSCTAPTALADSAVTTSSASIYWTTGGASTWIVEYDTAGFTQGTGNVLVVNTSSDTILTGLTSDTEYEFYVRDYCGGTDSSAWTGPATFFTGYCQVSTTNTGDYLSEITTTGANTNINYTASSQPTNSYSDETVQVIESFPGGSFDFSTTYVGGSNGVNIWADLNNDLDFDDVGELVFSQANASATKTGVISIPAVLPLGNYRVRVRGQFGSTANPPACGNVAWGSTVDFTLSIVAPPACLAPSALADSALTTTSADVYWNTGGSGETEWQIEYDTTGFVQGTGITQVVTDSVAPLSGLTPATTYDAYVRAICGVGDSSTWVGPITFTTLCAPFTATYTQDFDAFTAAADFNNANVLCWTAVGPGANDVELSSTLDFTGTIPSLPNVIEFNDGDLSANDTSVLVSPQFTDLPSGLNRIRFQAAFESATPSDVTLIVGVMTDPNDLSTFTSIDTLDASDVGGEDVFGEVTISLDNTGLIGSAEYIAFIHGPGIFEAYLDDFIYEPIPSCDLPTAVNDSAVTTSSAVIYWTDNSVATDYFVEYGAPGFTAGSGMDTVVDANPFTLIGLDAGTTYEVRVRAICGPTDTSSVLANSTTFTTIPTCFPPTSIDVTGVSLNTVDLIWLDTLASGSYQLEYDLEGFAQDTGNFVVVNDTFTTLTGLLGETSYDVYIRSLCGVGDTSAWFGPLTVFTGYCQPAPTIVDGDGITNVTFGQTSIVNNSTFAETNNYGDYSAQIGDGAQSTVVNVDITLETGWEYYTNIWIDWNNDLIFDASELVFDELSTDDNPTIVNASFLIPATVTLGNYRMRIGAVDTSFAGPITPCYTGAFGAFEDYTLEVTAAPTCLQAIDFGTTNVSGTSVDVYWTDPSSASEYVIEYGLTGFTQGTGTLDTVSNDTVTLTGLTVVEDYDIFVRTVCAVGDTSFTSNFTFNSGTICDNADIQFDAVNDCAINSYNVDLTVADLGDASTLYVTDGTDTLTTITAVGLTSVGPFNSGTSVTINVLHDSDNLCDLSENLINTPCNDDLCDAQPIVVNGDTLQGSNIGATAQIGEPEGSCFGVTTDTASVWYSFVAPANGSVTVSTDLPGGTLTDTQIAIYELNSSDCADVDSLVEVGCDEDGGTIVTFNSVADVTGLTPGETYYVQVDGYGTSNGTFSIFVSTDCEIPTNLTAVNETETSVDLAWDENGAATSWLVEYGPLGFTQGTGTQVVANANPYTLSGLTEGDSLQYFVRAICSSSDSSAWSLISDTVATLVICNDPTAVTTTDVSPNEVEVSWTDASGATTFEVEYGEAGFTQGTGTVVTVSTSPASISGLDGDTDYEFYVRAACDAANGQFSNWVGGSFTTLVSCPAPYDLVLSNVTDSSVTVAWSDTSGATSWQVEYGTPGFALGTGSTVNASTNPVVISGLNQNAQYEFYITSICGLGDVSVLSDVSNVITTLQTGIVSVGGNESVNVYGHDNTIYMKFDNVSADVANVKVFNLVGKVIAEDVVETVGTQTLQVGSVATGMYIVKLEVDDVTNTIKVFLTNK